jgi:hypothetical protein
MLRQMTVKKLHRLNLLRMVSGRQLQAAVGDVVVRI